MEKIRFIYDIEMIRQSMHSDTKILIKMNTNDREYGKEFEFFNPLYESYIDKVFDIMKKDFKEIAKNKILKG